MKKSSENKKKQLNISKIIAGVAAAVFLLMGVAHIYIKTTATPMSSQMEVPTNDTESINRNIASVIDVYIDDNENTKIILYFGFGIAFLIKILEKES